MIRTGGSCTSVLLVIYTLVFWGGGLALIGIGLWMLLDPRRNYILDLVHFSEDEPLLTFAAYTSIVAGLATLAVGFIACCGAVRKNKCLLGTFMLCLVVLFISEVGIGTLALVYRNKFSSGQLPPYLQNMTHNRYNRDYWVKPLLDTVQFYIQASQLRTDLRTMMKFEYGVSLNLERNRHVTALIDKLQFNEECCGSLGAGDWTGSKWLDSVLSEDDQPHNDTSIWEASPEVTSVPITCCRQIAGASALNPVARSLARCQQPTANKQWRHTPQQCCGGYGPRDYEGSFWYITNTERGTRSFVPQSCCLQAQDGRAWAIRAVDPMCTTYHYNSSAHRNAVHTEGCHAKLLTWFDEQVWIFAGIGFGCAAYQMIGLILSLILCNSIRYVYSDREY